MGKQANFQVAVTSVNADPAVSWSVRVRLYLPREWTDDLSRGANSGVPREITFQTKPQITVHLLNTARTYQISHKVVIADADVGKDPAFLAALESRQERYVVAVPCHFPVIVKGQAAQGRRGADEVLRRWRVRPGRPFAGAKVVRDGCGRKFVAIRMYRAVEAPPQQLG